MKQDKKDLVKLKRLLSAQYANACRRKDKDQAALLKRVMKKVKL